MELHDVVYEILKQIKQGIDNANKNAGSVHAFYPSTIEFDFAAADFTDKEGRIKFKLDTYACNPPNCRNRHGVD